MYDYLNIKKFEKSQINGLTKYLSGLRFKEEFRVSGTYRMDEEKIVREWSRFGLTYAYNDSNIDAIKLIFEKPRKITKAQSNFGKIWLKDFFFKKDGTPRRGQRTQYVSDRVLEISKRVSRFEFVGVLGCMNGMGEIMHFLPIYRTYDRKGNYFDYAPVHWGQPVIMEG